MSKYTVSLFFLMFCGVCYASDNKISDDEKHLDDYKTYSLARCITDNYKSMGVDFSKAKIKDGTLGFIDIDEGLLFSANDNNELDLFIRARTRDFYKPKQNSGDLAGVNTVVLDCVDFFRSSELDRVLRKIILQSQRDKVN